jgi:hypothetical protein
VSAAIVADARAARKLRHDLHRPLAGISHAARLLRGFVKRGGMPVEELARVAGQLERLVAEIAVALRD